MKRSGYRCTRGTAPYAIKLSNGQEFRICACGLSQNKPYCDGHHRLTHDEGPGKVYVYRPDGTRVELINYQ
ncbi:MAG: CDGSH iron-sulfur domain-containing protein [Acidilobus sp.]|jgi:CDGSH-type Zn-finger protein|nr:CDGSH iron-sulfur domain-containing protein [Acidilobus sp.]